jgi:hypothetical protein
MGREYNALEGYPEPTEPRIAGPQLRTIKNRIAASYLDHEFYDGDRKNGYGGMKDDGRWKPIAQQIKDHYGLKDGDKVLQLRAHKGFLLKEMRDIGLRVTGCSNSRYAVEHSVVPQDYGVPTELPYWEKEFDLVIAANVVYTLNLADTILCLKEIERVSKGKSWITLVAYENDEDVDGLMLMRYWTLLGTTILTKSDWMEVMAHAGYSGDWCFHTAKFMNLIHG